jgi:hypothetical protein
MQIAQSPAAEIYVSVIEPDLRAAMNILPSVYNGSELDNNKKSSGNHGLQTFNFKVYLAKMDSARDAALQVINNATSVPSRYRSIHKKTLARIIKIMLNPFLKFRC